MKPTLSISSVSRSAEETQAYAARLAPHLKKGDVVLLNAQLGSGKTTFVQGLIRRRGIDGCALSPTFILAQTYSGRVPIHHLDFYRLTPPEILGMGLQDYFSGQGEIAPGILLVEWADRCRPLWPHDYLNIHLSIQKKTFERKITWEAVGTRYVNLLKKLKIS